MTILSASFKLNLLEVGTDQVLSLSNTLNHPFLFSPSPLVSGERIGGLSCLVFWVLGNLSHQCSPLTVSQPQL